MSQKPKNKWDGPILATGAIVGLFALSTCAKQEELPDLRQIQTPEPVKQLLDELDFTPDHNR